MRIFYLFTAFCFFNLLSSAQGTTGFSGTGVNIDVYNYQIYWRVNPDSSSKGIKGVVKIKFKTTVANVSSVSFDLGNSMVIDKLERGAIVLSTPTITGNKFTAVLGTTLFAIGTKDSVTVTYHGVPPAKSSFGGAIGFQKTNDPPVATANSGTTGINSYRQTLGAGSTIYTLSESYEDRDWWPCKADMQDKADTIDISVNVPYATDAQQISGATDTFWVATNGTLIDSTIDISGKQAQRNRTFTFINRYPMATYLVGLSIARYNRYYRGSVNVGGFNVPVVYYLFAGKTDYTPILNAMDKVTELLHEFSLKFGDYGFLDKLRGGKHGFYEGLGTFGGMEHQTFSAISTNSLTNLPLLAHELSHQWFGDKVSFSTWDDLWLAEGFAKYSESLAPDLVSGLGYTSYSARISIKNAALTESTPITIPNSYIVNSDSIWAAKAVASQYSNSIYVRGAMVVSMLRTISGDTKFFNVLKDYQTAATLQYKSATTDTLKKRFADTLGLNLDKFFFENVDSSGYPDYNIGYQYYGTGNKSLALRVLSQTRMLGGGAADVTVAKYFNNPVVIHVKGPDNGNDTTIVFYDKGIVSGTSVMSKAGNGVDPTSASTLYYNLSFAPNSIVYDDGARTMSTGSMSLQTALDLKILDFNVKQHSAYNEASLTLDDNSINSAVILERSANGNNFEDIGNMILQGNAGISKKYLFNDVKPLETDNYYRAKYKNTEGIYLYSKIAKIRSVKTFSFFIVNNPVQEILQIRTADAVGKDVLFTIYDAAGRQIKNYEIKKVSSRTEIPVIHFHAGLYILKISIANEEVQNLKFIVK